MNPTVIITGHSYGLGAALAAAWLETSACVIGLARSNNAALAATHPGQLHETAIDLADPPAVLAYTRSDAFRHTCQEADTLWLFNNAGTVAPSAPLGAQADDDITHALNLNITAPLLLANATVAHARDRERVRIVHISSGAARGTRRTTALSTFGGGSKASGGMSNSAVVSHHSCAIRLRRP